MSDKEIKDLSVSIHEKLLNQARASGRPFNEYLQYYAIERFLYRLTKSRFANLFILKGALLFRAWGISNYRPTRDIDLLGYTKNDVVNLIAITREICGLEVSPDGIQFNLDSIHGESIKEDADYPGVRIWFAGSLGNIKLPLQLDIGFDDVVTPAAKSLKYPVILNMPIPIMKGYPPETVIAEKVQAMIFLGSINSRMKDFFDVWLLAQQSSLNGKELKKAIQNTFKKRNTQIPSNKSLVFSKQFANEKQKQWESFLKRSNISDAPIQFELVLDFLRTLLIHIFNVINLETCSGGDNQ